MHLSAEAANVRRRVSYTGRVQGVGFRYTTRELARGFRVAGYVRNLDDGTVELEAEGAAGEVSRFLEAIGARFAANIQSQRVSERPTLGTTGFEIA